MPVVGPWRYIGAIAGWRSDATDRASVIQPLRLTILSEREFRERRSQARPAACHHQGAAITAWGREPLGEAQELVDPKGRLSAGN